MPTAPRTPRRSPARTTSRTCCAGSPTGTSPSSATATSPPTASRLTPERARARRAAQRQRRRRHAHPRAGRHRGAELLVLTRASAKSRVLRPVQPYYVAVRVDRRRRHGCSASTASSACSPSPRCYENVLDIPVVERQVRGAIHRAGFPLASYSGQQMLEVISALPREELFSAAPSSAARHRRRGAGRRRPPRRPRLPAPRPVPAASSPAWSTCRATATPRRRASRWPRCCARRLRRDVGRLHRPAHRVRARPRPLHGAHRSGRHRPVRRGDVRAGGRRRPPGRARRGRPHLGRPPRCRVPRQRRGRRPCCAARSRRRYKEDVDAAQALADLRYVDRP